MAAVILLGASILSSTACGQPAPSDPHISGTQLLVDDLLIAERAGTVRRVHAGRKLPTPVLSADMPWEQAALDRRVYVYGTVLREPGSETLRMWYNRLSKVLMATSEDGIHWQRPHLGLCDYRGSRDNNLLNVAFHSPSVIRDDHDSDPAKRFKMLGYVSGKGYCGAYSADGMTWYEYEQNPVLPGGDTCTLSQDPLSGEYLAFHKLYREHRGHRRRLVFLSTSRDMQDWSPAKLIMAPDEVDDAQTRAEGGICSQFYNMSTFPYGNQWLGMVTHFRYSRRLKQIEPGQSPDDGPIDVQLVHSRDGRAWQRLVDRTPVIANGPHEYDRGCILGVANSPVVAGDELWIYYTAITTTHGGAMPAKQITIARAAWRRDGFVSLDAGDGDAVIETVPLQLDGDQLYVNADAAKGRLTVELLDRSGEPVPGYTGKECIPIDGDAAQQPVSWRAHARLPANEAPMRIRFQLRNCSLFSFTVTASRDAH